MSTGERFSTSNRPKCTSHQLACFRKTKNDQSLVIKEAAFPPPNFEQV